MGSTPCTCRNCVEEFTRWNKEMRQCTGRNAPQRLIVTHSEPVESLVTPDAPLVRWEPREDA